MIQELVVELARSRHHRYYLLSRPLVLKVVRPRMLAAWQVQVLAVVSLCHRNLCSLVIEIVVHFPHGQNRVFSLQDEEGVLVLLKAYLR